jgi:hypothetical protein
MLHPIVRKWVYNNPHLYPSINPLSSSSLIASYNCSLSAAQSKIDSRR